MAAEDGTLLYVYRWLPPVPCKAVVQIAMVWPNTQDVTLDWRMP